VVGGGGIPSLFFSLFSSFCDVKRGDLASR
jgi:hypothetical protein